MKRIFLCAVMAMFALTAMAQELNVGSFNVRTGGSLRPGQERPKKGDYAKFNGWDDRKQYIGALINLEAFDVFGSQEVKHKQLLDMVEMLPDYDYVGVARDDGATKGEYCPVFYRKKEFKLLNSGTFWLSETPDEVSKGWDGMCRRICTWAYLQRKSDKARLYFISTHLDHRGKVAQIEGGKLVLDWIKKNCKGETVIVFGDFNVTQTSDCYKVFAESGLLEDTYETARYRFAPTGTFNGFNPRRYTTHRIDHIFVSKGTKVSRYGVLTYHYFRDMKAAEEAMDTLAPKEIKGENRDSKCISDHYAIQSFITLKGGKKGKK